MSELVLSDGQSETVLPATAEEKARQVPDPVTYHLLCVLPKAEESYESGLLKAGQTMHFEEVLSPVLFVMKMGPDCYKDPIRFPSGPSCKVGDFVLVRPNSGGVMRRRWAVSRLCFLVTGAAITGWTRAKSKG